MTSTLLIGATGMVGSHILSSLCSSSSISTINVLSRRQPTGASESKEKIAAYIEADTGKWAPQITSLTPPPQIFFSALGTTRANAGSFENQYKLEHDLHLELAQTAKESGCKVFVLISAAGASTKATFGYPRMKGEIEEGIKALEFDRTIIIRPGLISGIRSESRPAEAVIRKIADIAGHVNTGLLKDGWAQDADMIAKAAVNAGVKALSGQSPGEKVQLISGREIISTAHES